MAFAQLTYRESLRDIETCLSVTRHRNSITWASASRSGARSLADANERRDLAYPCGVGPAAHHPGEDAVRRRRTGGLDLTNTVYALDSTTIALCLSVFPWAHFRTTKASGEDVTRSLDLRGNIPKFYPGISDGKLHDVQWPSICSFRVRSFGCHLRRGSWLRRLCPPLCVAPSRGLLRHACQVEHRCSSRLFGADGSLDRHHLRPDHGPWTASTPVRITPNCCRRIRFKDPEPGKTLVFITNNFSLPAATICALYKEAGWQVELFFK